MSLIPTAIITIDKSKCEVDIDQITDDLHKFGISFKVIDEHTKLNIKAEAITCDEYMRFGIVAGRHSDTGTLTHSVLNQREAF